MTHVAVSVNGTQREADVEPRTLLVYFLRETLGLELNQQKTLITHARTGAATFLGYEIQRQPLPSNQRRRRAPRAHRRDQSQVRPTLQARQTRRSPSPFTTGSTVTSCCWTSTKPRASATSSTPLVPPTSRIKIRSGRVLCLRIGGAQQRCRSPIPSMPSSHASRP